MQPAFTAAHVMADPRLADAGGNRIADQLLMALEPGLAFVDQGHALAIVVDQRIVDARDRADPAGGGPGAAGKPVGRGDPLAALDQRPDFLTRQHQRFE